MRICSVTQESQTGDLYQSRGVISAKKYRKTIEWESLEIVSRKLDTKKIFHAKRGTIKDRNGMDLTDTEEIKKRWKDYTETI